MPRDQEIDCENQEFHVIYTFSHGGMDPLEFPVQNRLKTLNLEIGAAQMIVSALFDSCQGLEKLYLTRVKYTLRRIEISFVMYCFQWSELESSQLWKHSIRFERSKNNL